MTKTPQFPSFHVDLTGQVAVVLGASAEGGTGWAIAQALARQGAKVVVAARSLPPLQRLAEQIDGLAVACDAGKPEDIARLADTVLQNYGRLDIAVNSAALPLPRMINELTEADLHSAMQVNFVGNTLFIQHMARVIEHDGSIIFISSLSTTHPLLPHAAYASAKAASDCMIRYAALEYADRNIRINSILPGAIRSDMTRGAFDNPNYEKALSREVPLARVGLPEDFANAVLWFAGPAFVTGLNLPVSGGNQLTRFPYLNEFDGGKTAFDKVSPLGDR